MARSLKLPRGAGVSGMSQVTLGTGHIERSREFYAALGFGVLDERPGELRLRAPGGGPILALAAGTDAGSVPVALAVRCGDLSAQVQRLVASGYVVQEADPQRLPPPRSEARAVHDPDGRTIYLQQSGPRGVAAALRSQQARAGMAAGCTLAAAVLVVVALRALEIAESPTIVTVLLIPLVVYGIASGRLREFTGPGGWGAKFAEVETEIEKSRRRLELQASDIESIRVALRGLVSKHEIAHLRGLAQDQPHIVNYGTEFYDELKRLDDFRFLLPKPGFGLFTLRERYGQEEHWPLEQRTRFDLHDYLVITDEGRKYLDLYEAAEGAGANR